MAKKKDKHERIDKDYYPSPKWTYEALLSTIRFKEGDVLSEPAMGDGRIYNAFPDGHEKKWAELSLGRDYLNPDIDMTADVIITNPPFSLFMEFLKTGIYRDLKPNGTLCFLLRLSVLGSNTRADFWREFSFTNMLLLTPRPSFVHGGSDNSEYAWFCFDYGNRIQAPVFWVLKREEHDPDYTPRIRSKYDNLS